MKADAEHHWQQLVAALADGVIIVNHDGIILYINDQAAQLFGRTPTELVNENFLYPMSSNDAQEIEIMQPGGKVIIAEMNVKLGAWFNDSAWIISIRNITSKKRKAEQLELAAKVFNAAQEGIMVTNKQGILIATNKALSDMTGYSEEELLNHSPSILKSKRHSRQFFREMWTSIMQTGYWIGEIWQRHKSGKEFPALLSISTLKNQDEEIINYIGFCHDLILQKKQKEQITHLKYYDSVTNLPNQYFLSKNLESMMQCVDRSNSNLIIIYIAINGTKKLNNLSIRAHNRLIMLISKRLISFFNEQAFLARISYHEFIAVLEKSKNAISVLPTIKSLIHELSNPLSIGKENLAVSSNIGITTFPQEHILYSEELIRQAHLAGYEAKLIGDNEYKFFDHSMELQEIQFNRQVQEIRSAIKNNQLRLFFQPKVNMATGKILGVEALIRLDHPQKGILCPAEFLSDITNHSISAEIGEWVLEHAFLQLEQWMALNLNLPISINISPYHLQQINFLNQLKHILANHPTIPPHLIELELLESEALQDGNIVKKVINECKKIGILFALDDFGTGYSSLAYLKELPATRVKLDQSFVRDITQKPENIAILKACISMCHSLKREVIAEGVETVGLGKLLLYLGCSNAQGYAVAKPMPADHVLEWINNWSAIPEWELAKNHKKEGLRLINAIMAHSAKIESVKQFLSLNDTPLTEVKILSCPLDKWLKNRMSLNADNHEIKRLHDLHKKIYNQLKELTESGYQAQKSEGLKKVARLELLSSKLLNQLLLLEL